jgi:hypothetical protein
MPQRRVHAAAASADACYSRRCGPLGDEAELAHGRSQVLAGQGVLGGAVQLREVLVQAADGLHLVEGRRAAEELVHDGSVLSVFGASWDGW